MRKVICNSIGQDDECKNCGASHIHYNSACEPCMFVSGAKCEPVYTVIEHDENYNVTGKFKISYKGALIIWEAYIKLWRNQQTMEQREQRGGICWQSELEQWKERGVLAVDFDYKKYEICIL